MRSNYHMHVTMSIRVKNPSPSGFMAVVGTGIPGSGMNDAVIKAMLLIGTRKFNAHKNPGWALLVMEDFNSIFCIPYMALQPHM